MNDQFLTELQNVMGGSGIFMEEPMKKHTTFRVGGPADVLVQPDETALAAILAPVSYTHLDVYKRQGLSSSENVKYND